jgi:hypothetical protein
MILEWKVLRTTLHAHTGKAANEALRKKTHVLLVTHEVPETVYILILYN